MLMALIRAPELKQNLGPNGPFGTVQFARPIASLHEAQYAADGAAAVPPSSSYFVIRSNSASLISRGTSHCFRMSLLGKRA